MPRIFISYRHKDHRGATARIRDSLVDAFGDNDVYIDWDLPPGREFPPRLIEKLRWCDVLVAVIGPYWLGKGAPGKRRIDSEWDWVREEIRLALVRRVPVLPLLIEHANLPTHQELPLCIRRLSNFGSLESHHSGDSLPVLEVRGRDLFRRDMNVVHEALREVDRGGSTAQHSWRFRIHDATFLLDGPSEVLRRESATPGSVRVGAHSFHVLREFVKRAGELVLREEIEQFIAEAEGLMAGVDPGQLRGTIRSIRRALGDTEGRRPRALRCLRKRGYVLDVPVRQITIPRAERREYLARLEKHCTTLERRLFPPAPVNPGASSGRDQAPLWTVPLYLLDKADTGAPDTLRRTTLANALERKRRLLIIGPPGSGKSTLMLMAAKVPSSRRPDLLPLPNPQQSDPPLPVLIRLTELVETARGIAKASKESDSVDRVDLLTAVKAHLTDNKLKPATVERTLGKGAFVFMLDGLDEIDASQNLDVELSQLAALLHQDWVAICSRPVSPPVLARFASDFLQVRICPLRPREKWELLNLRALAMGLCESEARQQVERLWDRISRLPAHWQRFTGTPLLLSLLAYLLADSSRDLEASASPSLTMYELYEQVVREMLGPLTSRRRDARQPSEETKQRRHLFRALCGAAMEKKRDWRGGEELRITGTILEVVLRSSYWPSTCPQQAKEKSAFLTSFLADSPLFQGPMEDQTPLHLSFLEFGCAQYLAALDEGGGRRALALWKTHGPTSLVPLFFCLAPLPSESDSPSQTREFAQRRSASAQLERKSLLAKMEEQGRESPQAYLAFARIVLQIQPADRERRDGVIECLEGLWYSRGGTFQWGSQEVIPRRAVAEVLALDRAFVELCCERLEDSRDAEELSQMADLLPEMGSPFAREAMMRLVGAGDNRVRWAAVLVLGRVGHLPAIEAFKEHWGEEPDWDVRIAMLQAACGFPAGDVDGLLKMALDHPGEAVVRWEAEIAVALRAGGDLITHALEPTAISPTTGAEEEHRASVLDGILRAIASDNDANRRQAVAAIDALAETASGFAASVAAGAVPRLAAMLHSAGAEEHQWQVARALKTLALICAPDGGSVQTILEALEKLDPDRSGYARGEIARVLGDAHRTESIEHLCRHYTLEGIDYERLWIVHSLWQLTHGALDDASRHAIKECAGKASRTDSYIRVRHWAELALGVLRGKASRI